MSNSKIGEMLEMLDKVEPKNNPDDLLMHLEDGSLAARLVRAHGNCDPANPTESMKDIIQERLQQVRRSIDGTED